MTDVPVYQVRKVFDPATFSVVEELVETGKVTVAADAAPEAQPAAEKKTPTKDPKPKPVKRRRKKKSDA